MSRRPSSRDLPRTATRSTPCPPGPIVTNRLLYKNLSYDPDKWVPISLLATVPYVLMARKNLEAKTIQELIATAKANPKTVTVASAGPGLSGTLATSNFEMMAGIGLNAIPYRGLGPAIKDVVAGQVDLMFDTITTSLPLSRRKREDTGDRNRRSA